MTEHNNENTASTILNAEKHGQEYYEALIRLAVLLYQIDGKITLTEQDYFEDLVNSMHWTSNISQSAFVNQVIHEARQAISNKEALEYLRALRTPLNLDAATAFEIAMDITAVDGRRSDEELELLSMLSNRILAKHLVA